MIGVKYNLSLNITLKALWGLLLFSLTLLIINDFFPLTLPFQTLSMIQAIVLFMFFISLFIFLLSMFEEKERKPKRELLKRKMILEISVLTYGVSLIIILQSLGGTSRSGLSLTNPIFIIVILIFLTQVMRQIKKLKDIEE